MLTLEAYRRACNYRAILQMLAIEANKKIISLRRNKKFFTSIDSLQSKFEEEVKEINLKIVCLSLMIKDYRDNNIVGF